MVSTLLKIFMGLLIFISINVATFATTSAIWIWEEDAFSMLDKVQTKQQVEAFLIEQHIDTMYLYADSYEGRNILEKEPEKYRQLIASAHDKGIKVFALLGSEHLKTQAYILPKNRTNAVNMFKRVLDFNKNATNANLRFDGVNIDIEPYLLDDWSENRATRGRQYLELADLYMQMKKEAKLNIPVGPAMPFWYDGIEDVKWKGQKRKLNESVQDIFDYVAIMDYRNVATGSDSIVSLAEEELNYADKIGKPVMIGVETHKTTPAKITFYGLGIQYFRSQLALAAQAMSKHPSFNGFVIDHLQPYRDMVKENK